jgi:hypothetical protein
VQEEEEVAEREAQRSEEERGMREHRYELGSEFASRRDALMRDYKQARAPAPSDGGSDTGSSVGDSETGSEEREERERARRKYNTKLAEGHSSQRQEVMEEYSSPERGAHKLSKEHQKKARRRHQEAQEEAADRERRKQEWAERHAGNQQRDGDSKAAQTRERKQGELAAALEMMRQVFADRDEKQLTIWLARANNDAAAAIDIGLAYEQKAHERRARDTMAAAEGSSDEQDPLAVIDTASAGRLARLRQGKLGAAMEARAKASPYDVVVGAKVGGGRRAAATGSDSDEAQAHPSESQQAQLVGRLLQQASVFDQHDDIPGRKKPRRKMPKQRRASKRAGLIGQLATDMELPVGTVVHVDGHGRGLYVAFKKKTFGANEHTLLFGRKTTSLKLKNEDWSIDSDEESDDSEQEGEEEEDEDEEEDDEEEVPGSPRRRGRGLVESLEREEALPMRRQTVITTDKLGSTIVLVEAEDGGVSKTQKSLREQKGAKRQKSALRFSSDGGTSDSSGGTRSSLCSASVTWVDENVSKGTDASGGDFAVGDPVDIFSSSADKWVRGEVTEVSGDGRRVTVEYGDRSRVIDLRAPNLAEFFRRLPTAAPLKKTGRYRAGEAVEVFSQSAGQWVRGEITQIDRDGSLTVEYGGRSRIIDPAMTRLSKVFRRLAEGSADSGGGGSGSAGVTGGNPPSLLQSLRIAQHKLSVQREDVERLAREGFGTVGAALNRQGMAGESQTATDATLGLWLASARKSSGNSEAAKIAATNDVPGALKASGSNGRKSAGNKAKDYNARRAKVKSEKGATEAGAVLTMAESAAEAVVVEEDPVLATAQKLVAGLSDLDAMQSTLKSRLPPVDDGSGSDTSTDEEGDASPAAAVVAVEPHIPNAVVDEAKSAMDAERARILALLADFESKASAEDERLAGQAATKIQMTYRRHFFRMQCMRRVRAEKRARVNAGRCVWRAWRARQRRANARAWRASMWEMRRADQRALLLLQKRQHLAARCMQAAWRGYFVRDTNHKHKASGVLQKYVRRITVRKRAVAGLQAGYRGWKCRQRILPVLREVRVHRDTVATEITRFARGWLQRTATQRMFFTLMVLQIKFRRAVNFRHQRATVLQSRFRGHAHRRREAADAVLGNLLHMVGKRMDYQRMLHQEKEEAGLCIQRMIRGKKNRTDFDRKRLAVMQMQRVWRGSQARTYYLDQRQGKRRADGQRFLWAVNQLQARFRARKMRRAMLQFFLSTGAACHIQRRWRGELARGRLAQCVNEWCACMVLQRGLRNWIAERQEAAGLIQTKFLAMQSVKAAVQAHARKIVLCQARWRGKVGRREAGGKWDALNRDFAECYRINRAIVQVICLSSHAPPHNQRCLADSIKRLVYCYTYHRRLD